MPAFQLKQFQQQTNRLLQVFALPSEFHSQLTRLFQRYEQPSYRYGTGVQAPPEPAYHLQPLMMDELINELKYMAVERPRSALLLAQECWTDEYYETKKVAAIVLGEAPLFDLAMFQDTFTQMLDSAGQEHYDLLFIHSWKRFREEHPEMVAEWISNWLAGDRLDVGLSAIQSLIRVEAMDSLPTIFRLIEKFVIIGDLSYREEILQIMDGLAKLSPMETAHFLSELTTHFYGEKRMQYFRALCRSFGKPQRDFINRAFMDPSVHYHDEDVIDD